MSWLTIAKKVLAAVPALAGRVVLVGSKIVVVLTAGLVVVLDLGLFEGALSETVVRGIANATAEAIKHLNL